MELVYSHVQRFVKNCVGSEVMVERAAMFIETRGFAAAGFVTFVLQLQKGCYLYQFGQYAWTHLTLVFIQIPSSFFVSNIFDGIIWFLLPCGLVIINDIGAYLAGTRRPPLGLKILFLNM
jgi:CDP-diglyceride synthetase